MKVNHSLLKGLWERWRVKLVDEWDNNYHFSISETCTCWLSAFSKEIETNHKPPKFIAGDEIRIKKYKNIFSKGYTENWFRQVFVLDSVLTTKLWANKYLNGEKT